ncbi:MAG: Bax inhibitor-1/YccA family protein [Thermoflexaceae bacterium]|nr:Bax inhibitor-1/YccA family protein [Thermoflexaceae bacterium]
MSFDNNDNDNYNENDYMNSEWQGRTWSDNYYNDSADTGSSTSYSASDFSSSYSTNYTTGSGSAVKADFEENVLAQSFVFMAVALIITAVTAFYVSSSPRLIVNILFNDGLFYGLLISELVVVFAANYTVKKNLIVPSAILFTLYSVINGATLSIIFVCYTSASIASTFLVAAVMFGVMAVYGIATKKDLSSVGSFCLMGLIGIIVAGVVNMLIFKNSMLDMGISIIGIIIFIGLTAYDTQKIKNMSRFTTTENITCIALLGALELYLDFINIFLKLLSLMGRRRN